MSDALSYVKNSNNTINLILFVHGFTGSVDTWNNPNGSSFPKLLSEDINISSNFDVACYEYYTRLLDLYAKGESVFKKVKSIFNSSLPKSQKNICIEEISNHLRTVIRFELSRYENIVVVAHSMGGLVTKELIVKDYQQFGTSKIKMFLSLAVPHQGADLATIGNLISKNIQISNLKSLSPFITQLNRNWMALESSKPITKYFYGNKDSFVPRESAVSMDNEVLDIISLDDDHITICKPDNADSLVFKATISLIKEFSDTSIDSNNTSFQQLRDDSIYNDELFVLKLLVADVHANIVGDAKELFFNAEYIRKLLKGKNEQKKLEELYIKIKELYRDSYSKFLYGNPANSGLLVAEIYEKITEQDEQLLRTLIPVIKIFHKKGMLHQLADDKNKDVWWTVEKSLTLSKDL